MGLMRPEEKDTDMAFENNSGGTGGAFGKDRGKVGNMNLRQQMKRGTKRAPRGGGGKGGAPYFVNKYQPPDTGASDIIRVIPGEFVTPRVDFDSKDFYYNEDGSVVTDTLAYMKYIEYYHGTKNRSFIGSEGPLGEFKGKGDKSIGADWFWYEWRLRKAKNSKQPNSIRRSEKFAFTVLVQAPFYKVPRVDKESGNLVMNQNTNEPFYDWMKGSKRGNDEYAAAGYERKEGHLQHWSLSYSHWNTLSEYTDSLARHCRSCNSNDSIEQVALLCQHCGEAIVEFDSTSLSDEDLEKVRNEPTACHSCGVVDYLSDMIRCNQCDHGEQATLFDFDLEVKRVKTAGDSDSKQTSLQILRAIGPRPIDQMYGEDLRKSLPLDKIFAPTPIERQIELFGNVPAENQGGDSGSGQGGGSSGRQPSTKGARSYGQ